MKKTRFYSHLQKRISLYSFLLILLLSISNKIFSHGTVTSPASRVWNCYQENPTSPSSAACIAAVASHGTQPFYDWNEVNQGNANSMHTLVVPDSNLASGGRAKYGCLDQVRTDWVATPVSAGPDTITWTNSAPHATLYYRVYITKSSWNPSKPLTWNDLVLLVQTPPSVASSKVDIPVTLPTRTGKHVIYSIWQRSDSPEAFYSTSDVDFGSTSSAKEINEPSVSLEQNFPNPFKKTTTINYSFNKESFVSLKIYDVTGKEVSSLVNKRQKPGEYSQIFNRNSLKIGIYFYKIQIGDFIETKKLVIQD